MAYANIEDARAYQKAYRQANPDKVRAYYKANRDKLRSKSMALYEANRDKEIARKKAYDKANPEKHRARSRAWKQANPEKHRASSRAHYARNKAYYNLKGLERRRKVAGQTPAWNDRAKMLAIYAECSKRNEKDGYIKWHVDHIIPLRGKNVWGLHVHTNLRIILASKNQAKSNKYAA